MNRSTTSTDRRLLVPTLTAIAAAASLLVGCARTVVEDPFETNYDSADATSQLDFWHSLPGRTAVTNDEALHGLLLLLEGSDTTGSYEQRVAHFQGLGWLPEKFDEPSNLAAQRGTIARILVRALEIRGGVMMLVTNKGPRYATKELQFLGIMPYGDEYMVIDGLDYLGVISRAQDYMVAQGRETGEDLRDIDDIKDPERELEAAEDMSAEG